MALVNPNIALGIQPVQVADPLAQYGKIAAIQGAQQQNQLAQFQLQQAQREQESTNALNRAYQQSYDPVTGAIDINKLRQSLAAAGAGSKLPGVEKTLAEVEKQKLEQLKLKGEITGQPIAQEASRVKLLDDKLKQARSFLDTIDPASPDAPARYLAWHEANHKDPIIGPALTARGVSAEQARTSIMNAISQGPQAFANLLNQSKLGTEKFMELNKATVTPQNLGATTQLLATPGLGGAATVVPGSTAAVTMTPAQIEQDKRDRERIKQEGQRIGLEGRRVVVMEEEAKQKRDPVFQQRMAGARATGEAIAKGDVAAQQALPKILSRAEDGLRLIDEMVGKPAVRDASGKVVTPGTAPHPGFQGAVGATWLPGERFVPGTPAADFMSRFDQLKGASFLEAFESLKGGGSITETEGTKATSAINRMQIAQSENEFVSAARELQDVVRRGVELAKRKARSAPGGAGGVDTNNPLLK